MNIISVCGIQACLLLLASHPHLSQSFTFHNTQWSFVRRQCGQRSYVRAASDGADDYNNGNNFDSEDDFGAQKSPRVTIPSNQQPAVVPINDLDTADDTDNNNSEENDSDPMSVQTPRQLQESLRNIGQIPKSKGSFAFSRKSNPVVDEAALMQKNAFMEIDQSLDKHAAISRLEKDMAGESLNIQEQTTDETTTSNPDSETIVYDPIENGVVADGPFLDESTYLQYKKFMNADGSLRLSDDQNAAGEKNGLSTRDLAQLLSGPGMAPYADADPTRQLTIEDVMRTVSETSQLDPQTQQTMAQDIHTRVFQEEAAFFQQAKEKREAKEAAPSENKPVSRNPEFARRQEIERLELEKQMEEMNEILKQKNFKRAVRLCSKCDCRLSAKSNATVTINADGEKIFLCSDCVEERIERSAPTPPQTEIATPPSPSTSSPVDVSKETPKVELSNKTSVNTMEIQSPQEVRDESDPEHEADAFPLPIGRGVQTIDQFRNTFKRRALQAKPAPSTANSERGPPRVIQTTTSPRSPSESQERQPSPAERSSSEPFFASSQQRKSTPAGLDIQKRRTDSFLKNTPSKSRTPMPSKPQSSSPSYPSSEQSQPPPTDDSAEFSELVSESSTEMPLEQSPELPPILQKPKPEPFDFSAQKNKMNEILKTVPKHPITTKPRMPRSNFRNSAFEVSAPPKPTQPTRQTPPVNKAPAYNSSAKQTNNENKPKQEGHVAIATPSIPTASSTSPPPKTPVQPQPKMTAKLPTVDPKKPKPRVKPGNKVPAPSTATTNNPPKVLYARSNGGSLRMATDPDDIKHIWDVKSGQYGAQADTPWTLEHNMKLNVYFLRHQTDGSVIAISDKKPFQKESKE